MESICNAIKQDEEMYQDIVLYKVSLGVGATAHIHVHVALSLAW